jgi:hypothetical protein
MCKRLFAVSVILFLAQNVSAEKRTIACKTPSITASCYWTHGRLLVAQGAVNWRLWKIGTHDLLGIYSGPSAFQHRYENLDSEAPELPSNLGAAFPVPNPSGVEVYADFEVCPLEGHIEGHMQAACIESAKHLVVRK